MAQKIHKRAQKTRKDAQKGQKKLKNETKCSKNSVVAPVQPGGKMSKHYETAQQLGEALDFVSEYCEGAEDCDDCIFADHGKCCFSSGPDMWDINTVMLNMGIMVLEIC